MCELCGSTAPLQKSHIIPRFVSRWMKETGVTPYLRYGGNVDRRLQDLPTMELLCAGCENRFSVWETKFANEIFHPNAAGKTIFRYRSWLIKFAASLAWRAIQFQKAPTQNESPDLKLIVDAMERHLARFLLDREKNVGAYTQHIYPVGELAAPTDPGSPMLNRYLARTVQLDLLRTDDLSEVLIFVKLPMFMFFSVGDSKYRKWMETSRIKKSSILQPKAHILHESMRDYIVDKADKSLELLDSMSQKSRTVADKAVMKAIEEDPERVAKSKLMQAMLRDYESYGREAVTYQDRDGDLSTS